MTVAGYIQNATNLPHGDPGERLSQIPNSLAIYSQNVPAALEITQHLLWLDLGDGVSPVLPYPL